ncbi:hypothetical protein HSBAA_58470 [Vreelandella sulfidaeris]|uniref:Molybdenum cofactor biosynthesis protein B n=1 Tax=Vreelandella sulfidaeris TaxID=115553 RepID=A0A455UIQ3_9GAMM|nr:hypothetical protein HSBAA_58470 [Halomonas sulfidaeris]
MALVLLAATQLPKPSRCCWTSVSKAFGERFRQLSGEEIGSSTIQSRCLGGLANATVVFCLPGSTGACRTGWDGILAEQLDSRHKPCNFANLVIPGRGQHG